MLGRDIAQRNDMADLRNSAPCRCRHDRSEISGCTPIGQIAPPIRQVSLDQRNIRCQAVFQDLFDPIDGPNFFSNSRSEEHTSELQSLMRISYAVFCLKKKNKQK